MRSIMNGMFRCRCIGGITVLAAFPLLGADAKPAVDSEAGDKSIVRLINDPANEELINPSRIRSP